MESKLTSIISELSFPMEAISPLLLLALRCVAVCGLRLRRFVKVNGTYLGVGFGMPDSPRAGKEIAAPFLISGQELL